MTPIAASDPKDFEGVALEGRAVEARVRALTAGLRWHRRAADALAEARERGRLALFLQLLGNLERDT